MGFNKHEEAHGPHRSPEEASYMLSISFTNQLLTPFVEGHGFLL